MDFNKIEKKYDELISQLSNYNVMPSEAKELATRFLGASFEVNKIVRFIRNDMVLLDQSIKISYKQAIEKSEGKSITEKKINAEANAEYLKYCKELTYTGNNLEYFRSLLKLFEQGHIFYKGLALER